MSYSFWELSLLNSAGYYDRAPRASEAGMKWEGTGEKDVPKYTGLTERSGLPPSPACPSDSQTSTASVLSSQVEKKSLKLGQKPGPVRDWTTHQAERGILEPGKSVSMGFYHQLGMGSLRLSSFISGLGQSPLISIAKGLNTAHLGMSENVWLLVFPQEFYLYVTAQDT